MKKSFIQGRGLFPILLGIGLVACGLQPDSQALTESPPSQVMASPTCCVTPTPFPLYPAVVLQTDERINAVAINQHGNAQVAIGTDSDVRVYQYTYTADAVTVEEQWSVPSENRVLSVRFSPDGHVLATGDESGTVTLMESASGDTIGMLPGEGGIAHSIRFNPQGTLIACGGCNRAISLWDSQTLQSISVFPVHHQGQINDIVWSPDGTLIASASFDNTIMVWDVHDPENVLTLGGHSPGVEAGVESLAWSPGGSVLASGGTDTLIKIWDMSRRGEVVETLAGNKGSVKALVWSPDGGSLVAAAYGPLILWNVRTYEPTLMEGHANWVTGVDMTPDGQLLVSGGWDGKIIVWNLTQ
jgi:WD40 repeat protein